MHANGLVSFTVLIVSTIMKRRSMNPKNGLQASSPMAEIQNPVDQQRAHKRTRTNSQILPFPSPTKERQKEPKNEIIISDIIELAKIAPRTRSGWLVGDGLTHLVGVEPRFEIIAHQFGIPGALNGKNEIDKAVPVDQNGKLQPFHALARTIIYQQLAGNAAAAIFERVLKILLKGDESSHRILMPHHVLQTDIKVDVVDGKKRVLLNGELSGLSVSKSQYLVSLAEHYSDPTLLKDVDLDALSDADLFAKLTAVKGLGPWSVQMFMIFSLQRPDVLPVGDLGIKKGLIHFFGLDSSKMLKTSAEPELKKLCESWGPFATLGSLYMWKLADSIKDKRK